MVLSTHPHFGLGATLTHGIAPGRLLWVVGPGWTWDLVQGGAKSDFASGEWYSFALVKSGATWSFYVDGLLDQSATLPQSSAYSGASGLWVGAIEPGLSDNLHFFQGALDDYRVYDRALSVAEIRALFAAGGFHKTCAAPATGCSGACVDLQTSQTDCGACGNACGNGLACVAGTCLCPGGLTSCGGVCVDTSTDSVNCGACGNACAHTACSAGVCAGACAPGFGDCDGFPANGCETDLLASPAHCGACGNACALAHATAACTAGACTVASCDAGYSDCDGNPTNGCETDIGSGGGCPSGLTLMAWARQYPSMVKLASGNVLVVGGTSATEVFDIGTATWTPGAPLATRDPADFLDPMYAFRLPTGELFVSLDAFGEVFSTSTGSWAMTPPMLAPQQYRTPVLLHSGRILVTGGWDATAGNAAEIFDAASGAWTAAASMIHDRYFHSATTLPSGQVLVAGGFPGEGGLTSAEVYDPASDTWSATGTLGAWRALHAATLLPSGKVLVTGGADAGPTAEVFDPATGSWTATSPMTVNRFNHAATLLASGMVLVTGGMTLLGPDSYQVHSSAEVYDPIADTWTPVGSMITPRAFHAAVLLDSGDVLIAGGEGENGGILRGAEIYRP
jgi:hypothetical protein